MANQLGWIGTIDESEDLLVNQSWKQCQLMAWEVLMVSWEEEVKHTVQRIGVYSVSCDRTSLDMGIQATTTVRGTPSASDSRPSSASASAPATSALFCNAFGRMTSYATRSRPASAPDRMMSRDVA